MSNTELVGWVEMRPGNPDPNNKAPGYKLFFVAQFDKAMREFRAWKGSDLGVVAEIAGSPVVGYPRFQVSANEVVQMKCALSYCSVEQARSNMDLELTHWNFDTVRNDGRTERYERQADHP